MKFAQNKLRFSWPKAVKTIFLIVKKNMRRAIALQIAYSRLRKNGVILEYFSDIRI